MSTSPESTAAAAATANPQEVPVKAPEDGTAPATKNSMTKTLKSFGGGPKENLYRVEDLNQFDHLTATATALFDRQQAALAAQRPKTPAGHAATKKHHAGATGSNPEDHVVYPPALFPPFRISPVEIGLLCEERNRAVLAQVLQQAFAVGAGAAVQDVEAGRTGRDPDYQSLQEGVLALCHELNKSGHVGGGHGDEDSELSHSDQIVADHYAEVASSLFALFLLRAHPEQGLPLDDAAAELNEIGYRRYVFGSNAIAPKGIIPFWKLCVEAVQDFVLIMLIILGCIILAVEISHVEEGEKCTTCWLDGSAILIAVIIVVLVTAGIDYMKQFTFLKLTQSLHESNTKMVLRANGTQTVIIDDDIVVGDILLVNSHTLATIPADCMVLGPSDDLKMDESALTGESKLIHKKAGDIVLSGTNAAQGGGKLLVLAVGINSVAGKIKARVYESGDVGEEDAGDVQSPLFQKLDTLAQRIGVGGTIMASISFLGSLIIGLGIEGDPAEDIINYLITAITVLAVAVPEGLPLAVTLALAFSSSKMMADMNLVKHLDACETMGCATTICTDKTGTLTANKMTARAIFTGKKNFVADDPSVTLGQHVKTHDGGLSKELITFVSTGLAIDTMNETVLYYDDKGQVTSSTGNPTEVALLQLVDELGCRYDEIRNSTKGRADSGALAEFLSQGKQFGFSSARKMMSWAVPHEGGYRLFCKGASEVVLGRCTKYIDNSLVDHTLTEAGTEELIEASFGYARRGMRCIALAYRDLPAGVELEAMSDDVINSDGTPAFLAETELTAVALIGIEDPLRHEVPGAIEKCYRAGIDVRMVTGDNPNTAVSIAYQAGIIRDFHFQEGTTERVADNLKENVLLEGKVFRSRVYKDGDTLGKKEFDQAAFDKIWPHLRVLARSSPDDKLTLAHGLNQSNLFADTEACATLLRVHNITVFPDRQVIAMTGDGTNDAPALKRADIGFAMGIAGTQIAKDAADIILLDDNFASIVTAAKWGRNVYASIQKFLQFQLTVNIAAVSTALVGSFAYQKSPLAAIQLLWINLLMDSLASLALASEPPVDSLLTRPPVNRTQSMITKRMYANMFGQAGYQILVTMVLLFAGPEIFDIEPGHIVEERDEEYSVHYTIIFNTFVWMQLFNEWNSRKLKGEFNIFAGLLDNPMFYSIWLGTAVIQVIIIQYGSIAFNVADGGLDAKYWGVGFLFGLGSLPVQQLINAIYSIAQSVNAKRNRNRRNRAGALSTQNLDGTPARRKKNE